MLPRRVGVLMAERRCGVCGDIIVRPRDASKITMTAKGNARGFPGYRFRMAFCNDERHTAKEVLAAIRAAEDVCEYDAIQYGAYIARRFP